ncbi:MAG: citrate synthase [Caulobacter sp.]|nr:citrate synthase [Caulobacter sp.]
MDDDLYLTAAEAAAILGVEPATLYAYVSRKKLRSLATPGSQKRRYLRSDVLALAAKGKPSSDHTLLAGETAITLLTEEGTYYRGQSVIALAETESVESIAGLLWQADPEEIFSARLPKPAPDQDAILASLAAMPRSDRVMALLPVLERANPMAFDLSPSGFTQAGADMLRWLTALYFDQPRPSADPIHQVVARATGSTDAVADLVRRAMILVADQQFGDTTRAVRAAAITGVTPYGIAIVGLVVGGGQLIRFNRIDTVRRFVLEVVTSAHPEEAVISRVRTGEKVPGFEPLTHHRKGDVRADALMRACERVFNGDPDFERLRRALTLASELTRRTPGFVIPLIFLGHRLGVPGNELAVATIGRAIGWIAHAQEEMQRSPARPKAAYVGALPRPE